MSLTAPPVGARVRHTTTYTDGTTVTMEGPVVARTHPHNPHADAYILIGEYEGVAYLCDRAGRYTVSFEVLEQPLPPEPADGYYLDRDDDIWQRRDFGNDESHWCGSGETRTWQELNRKWGPLKRLIPDPAADAPTLPWTKPSYDDRYPALTVDRARDAGDVLTINGVELAPNQIRELMAICARHLRPGAERDELVRQALRGGDA